MCIYIIKNQQYLINWSSKISQFILLIDFMLFSFCVLELILFCQLCVCPIIWNDLSNRLGIFLCVEQGKLGKRRGKRIASHNKSLHAWRHQFASSCVCMCSSVFPCMCVWATCFHTMRTSLINMSPAVKKEGEVERRSPVLRPCIHQSNNKGLHFKAHSIVYI